MTSTYPIWRPTPTPVPPPATRRASEIPTSTRMEDRVEISDAARSRFDEKLAGSVVRHALIDGVRRQIASGTYVTRQKLEVTSTRLAQALALNEGKPAPARIAGTKK